MHSDALLNLPHALLIALLCMLFVCALFEFEGMFGFGGKLALNVFSPFVLSLVIAFADGEPPTSGVVEPTVSTKKGTECVHPPRAL